MALMETEVVIDELIRDRKKDRWFRMLRTVLWVSVVVFFVSSECGGRFRCHFA